MQAPADEQESTEGVVFDNFGCTQVDGLVTYRQEFVGKDALLSKSLYPRFARRISNPLTTP